MVRLDFKMSNEGDLELFDDNIAMIEDRDVYVQCFRLLLNTRKGEYFLNNEEGLDFSVFFGSKRYDEDLIYNALQDVANQLPEFVKYTSQPELIFNDQTRKFTINFEALFQDNVYITLEEEVAIDG